jgi:hypothetical protein
LSLSTRKKASKMSKEDMFSGLLWNVKLCVIFFASTAVQTTSSPFWDVTHRRLVVGYRRFGTAYRSHLQASSRPRRILDFAQRRLIQTFWDNLSVQPPRAKQPKKNVFFLEYLKIGPKRRYITAEVRCVTSQRTKTSNVKSASSCVISFHENCENLELSKVRCWHVDM